LIEIYLFDNYEKFAKQMAIPLLKTQMKERPFSTYFSLILFNVLCFFTKEKYPYYFQKNQHFNLFEEA